MRREVKSAHVHIAGVKGFIDGVTETYTGLLLEPYTDRPGTCGEGLPLHPRERMQGGDCGSERGRHTGEAALHRRRRRAHGAGYV